MAAKASSLRDVLVTAAAHRLAGDLHTIRNAEHHLHDPEWMLMPLAWKTTVIEHAAAAIERALNNLKPIVDRPRLAMVKAAAAESREVTPALDPSVPNGADSGFLRFSDSPHSLNQRVAPSAMVGANLSAPASAVTIPVTRLEEGEKACRPSAGESRDESDLACAYCWCDMETDEHYPYCSTECAIFARSGR